MLVATLARSRLYFVCDARPGGRPLSAVLAPALANGVDVFQLREKDAPDEQILAAAQVAAALCREAGALFVLNDRPDLVEAAGGGTSPSSAAGSSGSRSRTARGSGG